MVLVGADGVGKTLLARSAAERFAAAKPSTVMRWVVGTATGRIVPFGAFRALLDIADTPRPAGPPTLLRAAHDSLTADGGELLFVVDDAHHLDHLSATAGVPTGAESIGATGRHGRAPTPSCPTRSRRCRPTSC